MAQQQDLPYVDAVAMAPWWAESTLPIQQATPARRTCGIAVTGIRSRRPLWRRMKPTCVTGT